MIRQADPIANAIALTLPARRWLRVPGRPERTRHLRELPDACAAAGSNDPRLPPSARTDHPTFPIWRPL